MHLPPPDFDISADLAPRNERIAVRCAELGVELPKSHKLHAARVLLSSEFVMRTLERHKGAFVSRLVAENAFDSSEMAKALNLDGMAEEDAMSSLRRVRDIELARIAWRSIAGMTDIEIELAELSALADGLIGAAVRYATQVCTERYGTKYFADAVPLPLLVVAMGKLGGAELNFSSDVDLVLLYPDEDIDAAQVQPYYTRLAQYLIKLLDERTEDGFVYRLDTRLRPFGTSGPLAMGLSAFETYLVSNGRDWERYAYLKARLLTGNEYSPQLFEQTLRPYVFRRYLDYGVIDALRQIKHMIRQEVARRDMSDNVKLGPGGIREIEFIVQAHQLVRGGTEPDLRSRSLIEALPRITGDRMLTTEVANKLIRAYLYLRTIENRVQMLDDQQVHRLPKDADERSRLVLALGAKSWDALIQDLEQHKTNVEHAFANVVSLGNDSDGDSEFVKIWNAGKFGIEDLPDDYAALQPLLAELSGLRDSKLYSRMDEVSRSRLTAVLDIVTARLATEAAAADCLRRVVPVIEAICRRSAYLSLLAENPTALDNLLLLARRSARLIAQVADYPLLLDELLDARIFDQPPTHDEFRNQLQRQLLRLDGDDTEAVVEAIRQFQAAAVFRTAISDTLGHLPLMKVSDRLTDIAEICIQFALDLAWQELTTRHGTPRDPGGEPCAMAVIAYGKLGGFELGYGSDLDLVFVHDSNDVSSSTDGDREIANDVFFARLAQRFIHFLSIQTTAGRLYEIDTRLRPSGQSGLLVTSTSRFERYQRSEAWVWEHQALLRSRVVAGPPALKETYEKIRTNVLIECVNRDKLREEIISMRQKMRANLSTGNAQWFDIKQDEGGLADIEFLIDYMVLKNAPNEHALIRYPDNIRQLEALEAAEILDAPTATALKECYLEFRAAIHDAALDDRDRRTSIEHFSAQRRAVQSAWDRIIS